VPVRSAMYTKKVMKSRVGTAHASRRNTYRSTMPT
jgi:hypothetical protein